MTWDWLVHQPSRRIDGELVVPWYLPWSLRIVASDDDPLLKPTAPRPSLV